MNAREFLEKGKIRVTNEVDARKEKIDENRAWELLKDAAQVYIGSRGKYGKFSPDPESRREIMSLVIGRSGNLRAPALKVGNVFLIGFSEDMYKSISDYHRISASIVSSSRRSVDSKEIAASASLLAMTRSND